MTTPYFQIALNRDLEQDTARREKAMKVLNVMLSEEAQNRIISDGQDLLSYSQNVPLRLTEYMKTCAMWWKKTTCISASPPTISLPSPRTLSPK